MTVRWKTWSTSERKIFKVNVKSAKECVAEMTECQEVSQWRSVWIEKECLCRLKERWCGVCWGFYSLQAIFSRFLSKLSKVRCVTALACGPTLQGLNDKESVEDYKEGNGRQSFNWKFEKSRTSWKRWKITEVEKWNKSGRWEVKGEGMGVHSSEWGETSSSTEPRSMIPKAGAPHCVQGGALHWCHWYWCPVWPAPYLLEGVKNTFTCSQQRS